MPEPVSLEEFERAERQVVKEEARRGFLIHVVIYIVGNAIATALNLIVFDDVLWFYYPLIGWGIGLSIHYLSGVHSIENRIAKQQVRIEQKAIRDRTS